MKIEEQEIPSLIRQGRDREIIPLLYKTVFPKVKNYILKNRGNKQDADDVFQDAVLVFYKQVVEQNFDDKYQVFGYLYRICVNRWINKVRKNKRLVFVEDLYGEEVDEAAGSDFKEMNVLFHHENLLERLFAPIGEKCIEILTYTIYYNLMLEDIMIRMGLKSEGSVKMQLKRCRQKLYNELEKNPSLLEKIRGDE